MNAIANSKRSRLLSAAGAALTALCGLVLWKVPFGEAWVNASYDYLFRFGERPITNQVVVILMDNDAYDHFHQPRGEPRWDRELHARLLEKLADDGCALVVLDCFFRALRDPVKDAALANAMRRLKDVVLMAWQADATHRNVAGARPVKPYETFLNAARTNWGVAWFDPELDLIVRRHWPFPSPGPYPSLPWTAAKLAGASLPEEQQERWLRYYGPQGAWTSLGYRIALTQPAGFFRDKIVFIGNKPSTSMPGDEEDEFRTPYTRWRGESMGGVQINVTAFLNLMNGDWLRRPARWFEGLMLLVTGVSLGVASCRARWLPGVAIAVVFGIAVAVGAVVMSHFTNYWFPWLVVAGGQVPCALVWAGAARRLMVRETTAGIATAEEELPDTPGYELLQPSIGQGAYGKVWLARNTLGHWRAVKVVYLSKFDGNADPYARELKGIKRYMPVSDKHPGLLPVDFVSEPHPAGYFYYSMELGDSLEAGWEQDPSTYKPRDLVSERSRAQGRKMPVRECVQIGLVLADALDFLHGQALIHRDIKPQNVIFVNGRPKLADMGLVAEIRPPDQTRTYVGTPGYMPPPPEMPGTPQADIYALGVMLYVLSTGRGPTFFPEISTTLADSTGLPEFFRLNRIIIKACDPDCTQRYATAAQMWAALKEVEKELGGENSASNRFTK